MRKCLTQTVPYGLVQCLSRLNAVSDSSWTLYYYYNTPDSKIKAATALTLDSKTAKDISDVVTNNKPLVDEAFKFALASSSSSSSDGYEEESSEQDQEQEEEADDMEENDNNVLSEQSTRTEDAQLAGCMLNRLHGRDFQFN
ncbi:MAG TPA: hypothetical protein VFH28_03255 [Nitrososphaera sp.]|nr:hypothetical protein [Nitrososphaera sp.]